MTLGVLRCALAMVWVLLVLVVQSQGGSILALVWVGFTEKDFELRFEMGWDCGKWTSLAEREEGNLLQISVSKWL